MKRQNVWRTAEVATLILVVGGRLGHVAWTAFADTAAAQATVLETTAVQTTAMQTTVMQTTATQTTTTQTTATQMTVEHVSVHSTAPRETTAVQPSTVACAALVYLNDPDPKGTNVRSAPVAKSKVVATITDSDSELDITGSSGDWLRVRQVRSVGGNVAFNGDGWVFASLVAVRARGAAVLRRTPDAAGAVTVKLRDDEQLPVVGCRGDWLQVKHGTSVGWIGKTARCGNPVTTCS